MKSKSMSNPLHPTDDTKIKGITELLPPIAHLYELPITTKATELVVKTRQEISNWFMAKMIVYWL